MKNVVLILLIFSVGCTTSWHRVTGVTRPAISPDQVIVYYKMPKHSKIIGRVSADSYGGVTFQNASDDALGKMKLEAGSLGANGIVLDDFASKALDGAKVRGNAIFVSQ